MRLLKIGVYYSAYLNQFYARYPNLQHQAYPLQHAALINDCFGSSDFWTRALNKLGYETCDVIANAEPLQKMWAKEHGLVVDSSTWLFDITAAQVKAFQPDVLLVADYSTVTAEFLRTLKDACPSIRLILGWCGAPYHDDSVFRECDVVLSCVPELVRNFQDNGHLSRHVNHAFDARVLERIHAEEAKADFVFLGSVFKAKDFHIDREKILSQLIRKTDLRIWSDISQPPSQAPRRSLWSRLRRGSQHGFGSAKEILSSSHSVDPRLRGRSKPALFGLEMFQQLHDSRVALNTHIDISPTNASNMRLFEATGVGTCLLTDWKSNLAELFEIDAEVVAYRHVDECVEKVEYLLEHDADRRDIAAAGQRRTLRDHTFYHRAARIDDIIRESFA